MEVVLFKIHTRPDIDAAEYETAFERMLALVSQVPGFVSVEGYAAEDGTELAVACFENAEAIATWRDHPEHEATRDRGRSEFFEAYDITIATVDRQYGWKRREDSRGAGEAPSGFLRDVALAELDRDQAEQARAIYLEAFPAWEREDWDRLVGADRADALQIGLLADDEVIGLATLSLIGGDDGWWFLEYFAITAASRGRGLGSALWEAMLARIRATGVSCRVVFEIEPPDQPGISEAEQAVRTRRLRFYEAHGARVLPIPRYRIPRLDVDGVEPMLVLAVLPDLETVTRDELVELVPLLLGEYGLDESHALVRKALSSIGDG